MTSGDVVAVVGVAATFITAVASAITLVRRHSGQLSELEEQSQEDCAAWKRRARWVIRELRDLLAEHQIAEPEGIDDELNGRRTSEEKG